MNFHKEPLAKFFFFLKMLAIPNVTYIGLRVQMFEIHFTEESTSSLIALYILIIYSATFDCSNFLIVRNVALTGLLALNFFILESFWCESFIHNRLI